MAFEDAISGVKAARSAGMRCIGIAQPERAAILVDASANYVVRDFQSLSYSKLQQMFVNDLEILPPGDRNRKRYTDR
jgi:beta-phosphoglucomutase-like phosphatase (HAD superfamily)